MKSPNTIKTCFVAQVKEEMGFPVTRAHNRISDERKVKAPDWLKPIIKQAILELNKEKENPTYKEIQQRAFEIYKNSKKDSIVLNTKGLLKGKREEVIDFINDREIYYGF